jgi:RNA exonuclease 1
VYTTSGLTLARLTVLDAAGATILDERVVPQGAVMDLNTRFSGVTQQDIADAKLDTKSVRSFLGRFVGPKTIIVGHGVGKSSGAHTPLRWRQ